MITTLAPCGINCDLCYTYQKKNCHGCRGITATMKNHCSNCDILKCEKKENYCYECEEYPCNRLNKLAKKYVNKHKIDILGNLQCIKYMGEKFFNDEDLKRHACPNCGKPKTMHGDICVYCDEKGVE